MFWGLLYVFKTNKHKYHGMHGAAKSLVGAHCQKQNRRQNSLCSTSLVIRKWLQHMEGSYGGSPKDISIWDDLAMSKFGNRQPQLMINFPVKLRGEHFRQVAMISRLLEHDQLHVKLDESACRCLLLRRDELALALSELTSSGKGIFCHGTASSSLPWQWQRAGGFQLSLASTQKLSKLIGWTDGQAKKRRRSWLGKFTASLHEMVWLKDCRTTGQIQETRMNNTPKFAESSLLHLRDSLVLASLDDVWLFLVEGAQSMYRKFINRVR